MNLPITVKKPLIALYESFYKEYSSITSYVRNRSYIRGIMKMAHRQNKKIVLVFTHELTLTGAPIVCFDFVNILKEEGYVPLVVSLIDGELRQKYRENGISIVPHSVDERILPYMSKIKANYVIFNTIVSLRLINKYKFVQRNKFCWIHEAMIVFENHKQDNWKQMIEQQIKVLFVSEWSRRSFFLWNDIPISSDILNYGILDSSDKRLLSVENEQYFVIVGSVYPLKNQIGFIENCYIKLDEVFKNQHKLVIIGGGQ